MSSASIPRAFAIITVFLCGNIYAMPVDKESGLTIKIVHTNDMHSR